MSSEKSIPVILEIAKISQYLTKNDASKQTFLKGGFIDQRWATMIYAERKGIQRTYDLNPSDSTLQATGNYLYSLLRNAGAAESILNNVFTISITNPADQSINVGDSASFEADVTITNNLPYTIQWYKNGVLIPGATSQNYTATNVQLTDSGSKYNAVATASFGSATSLQATLIVNESIIGYYYYGDVNYYNDLLAHNDDVPYVGTFSILNGDPLTVPFGSGAETNKYNVVKYPDSQSVKTTWHNTLLNFGTIPDSVYRDIISFDGWRYIISRVAMSLDSTNTTVLYA